MGGYISFLYSRYLEWIPTNQKLVCEASQKIQSDKLSDPKRQKLNSLVMRLVASAEPN